MILNGVFERFAPASPLSVMARGVPENALRPKVVDPLLEDVVEKQSTRKSLLYNLVLYRAGDAASLRTPAPISVM